MIVFQKTCPNFRKEYLERHDRRNSNYWNVHFFTAHTIRSAVGPRWRTRRKRLPALVHFLSRLLCISICRRWRWWAIQSNIGLNFFTSFSFFSATTVAVRCIRLKGTSGTWLSKGAPKKETKKEKEKGSCPFETPRSSGWGCFSFCHHFPSGTPKTWIHQLPLQRPPLALHVTLDCSLIVNRLPLTFVLESFSERPLESTFRSYVKHWLVLQLLPLLLLLLLPL